MICPYCHSVIRDNSKFCTECGRSIETSSVEKPVNVSPSKPVSSPENKPLGVLPKALIGVAIAAVAVVAIIFAVLQSNPSLTAPEISDDEVLSNFDQTVPASSVMNVSTEWGSTDDFTLVSAEITGMKEYTRDGVSTRYYDVDVVYENPTYRSTDNYTVYYSLDNGEWKLSDRVPSDMSSLEPIAGVSTEELIAHVPSMIKAVDSSSDSKTKLANLYKANTSFTVKENNTAPSGGTATISISALDGFKGYMGTLTVDMAWDDTNYEWIIESCSADEDAYKVNYDALIGTWTGTLTATDSAGWECYGGREQPAKLVIKSVDNTAKTATADISCVVHNHASVSDSDVTSHSGDTYTTVNDVLFSLGESSEIDIYSGSNPTWYELSLVGGDGGSLKLKYYNNMHFDDNGLVGEGSVAWRKDTYELKKDSSSTQSTDAATTNTASDVSANVSSTSEYILPDSDSRYYTRAELEALGEKKLRLAHNEIHARHGKGFRSKDLQDYFDSRSWYTKLYDADEYDANPPKLNEFEEANDNLMTEMRS